MLHSKYLTAPLSFRRQCPSRNRMKNSVVAGNNLSSLSHMRPILLPMITRSQPLKLSSTVVKASSQDTTVATQPKHEGKKIKGRVVLMKKIVLDLNDLKASILDRVHELLGKAVSLRLISSVNGDPENESTGKVGKPAYLENWVTTITPLTAGETAFDVTFDWDEEIGVPGAFIVRNYHHSEFYLKTVTLEDVPGEGRVHFVCNSWVYPADKYKKDRVFFANKTYLPDDTPKSLQKFREEELVNLRGDDEERGELQEWDRVYDYAYYNDLGNPDNGPEYARPVLGGSIEYPYPRRGRTGRPATKTDPNTESRLKLTQRLNVYVPRDERFGPLKMSDLLAYVLKSIPQVLKPEIRALLLGNKNEFETMEDILKLYEGGLELPDGMLKHISDSIPEEMFKELFRTDGEKFLKFPVPQVIKGNIVGIEKFTNSIPKICG